MEHSVYGLYSTTTKPDRRIWGRYGEGHDNRHQGVKGIGSTLEQGQEKEVSEVLFSGLEVQGEISRLLEQLYGNLDQAPLGEAAGLERYTPRRSTEPPRGAQEQALMGECEPPRAEGQPDPKQKLRKLAAVMP